MTPVEAKVLLVDDDENFRKAIAGYLKEAGHIIAAEAETLPQALETVESLQTEGVDVALLDGNLSPHSEGGLEGKAVAEAFREKFPGKALFSISSDRQPWSDDPNLTAWSGPEEIVRKVTEA